jgi:cytoskeletal protein CcmA (bactofilin family)
VAGVSGETTHMVNICLHDEGIHPDSDTVAGGLLCRVNSTLSPRRANISGMHYRPFNRRTVTLLIAVLVVLAGGVGPVAAQAVGSDPAFTGIAGTVVIDEGETTSEVSGIAGTIIISGTVNGDLSGLAGDIVITETGTVNGDVNVATGSLRIAGSVAGSVSAGAGNVVVEPSGTVGGDFSVGAGNVQIAGTINGDATIGADRIDLRQGSVIVGGLTYDGQLTRHPAATVQGPVVLDETLGGGPSPISWRETTWQYPSWLDTVYGFFANLILGAILLLVFPGFSRRVADRVRESPGRSGAIGFLLLIGVPIALVLIAITIIGIPLAIIGIFVYMFAVWVGLVYGEYAVGHWILSRSYDEVNRWYALLLGLLLFALLGLIPFIGGLFVFVALLLGLGALGSAMRGAYRDRRGPEPSPTEATTGGEGDTSPA